MCGLLLPCLLYTFMAWCFAFVIACYMLKGEGCLEVFLLNESDKGQWLVKGSRQDKL